MKRQILTIALALIALAITAHNAFGQTMLDIKRYAEIFGFEDGKIRASSPYIRSSQPDINREIAKVSGRDYSIDTPLEFALLSYYGNIRIDDDTVKAKADAILPQNNPKLADQKLGAAVFQEIQILRFLEDTAAVSRHEAILKFITDRKNATRQEIETFYRDNVRALIAGVVDEEFNKVSVRIDYHNATLIRNPQTGQYTLSYGGVNTNHETRIITANSLDALLAEMQNGKNKNDFTSNDINTVKAQAALIPAVVYDKWKYEGSGDGMALVKETLTNFYLNPNDNTYLAAFGIRLRYRALLDTGLTKKDKDIFAEVALNSYNNAIGNLNLALLDKFRNENRFSVAEARRVPNDTRYNIFSTPYR